MLKQPITDAFTTVANTPLAITLPAGVKKFRVGLRDKTKAWKISYTNVNMTQTNNTGKYETKVAGETHLEEDISLLDKDLIVYVQTVIPETVEVCYWS